MGWMVVYAKEYFSLIAQLCTINRGQLCRTEGAAGPNGKMDRQILMTGGSSSC